MSAKRLATRRVFTESFTGEQMQRAGQDAATRVNDVQDTLDRYVEVALAQDFTTTATGATNTPLTFPVKDGELWCVEMWALAGCSNAAGMKYAVGAPPASTLSGTLYSNLTNAIDFAKVTISAANTLTSAVHTVAGGLRDDYLNVRIKVVGNGSVTIRACSTSAGTTTIATLALLRARRFKLAYAA